jgi:plastocyanin
VSAGAAPDTASRVTITAFTFRPNPLEIHRGTAVVWINRDRVRHTVTAGTRSYDDKGKVDGVRPSGQFDLDLPRAGNTARVTFTRPGRIHFYCAVHPGMDGEVVVS